MLGEVGASEAALDELFRGSVSGIVLGTGGRRARTYTGAVVDDDGQGRVHLRRGEVEG